MNQSRLFSDSISSSLIVKERKKQRRRILSAEKRIFPVMLPFEDHLLFISLFAFRVRHLQFSVAKLSISSESPVFILFFFLSRLTKSGHCSDMDAINDRRGTSEKDGERERERMTSSIDLDDNLKMN